MAMLAARVEQPGLGQRAKVQRHRAEGHVRHRTGDVACRALVLPDEAEDLAASRRRDGGKQGVPDRHADNLVETKMRVKRE
jgi:hypothetical protein